MVSLSASRVVLADRLLEPGLVEFDDAGRISSVEPTSGRVVERTLIPGLIDLQVNGHEDVDVGHAEGADWDRLDAMLIAQGVTAWCPTLVTMPLDRYAAPLARMSAAAARTGARPEIIGAHLEGPFLGGKPGAHPTGWIVPVDRAWLDALPEGIAVVTLAPECPGASEAIAWGVERGVVVALGHSAAGSDVVHTAIGAGATLVTHLFNGMSGIDHRAPGMAAAALVDDRVTTSVIADFVHVHADAVRLAFRCKPRGRIVLVTDAVAWRGDQVSGMGLRHDGTAPRMADGTLAGSALTLDRAVANVVGSCDVDLVDAVFAASTAPADLIGRGDLGRIAVGARADLVALDDDLACTGTWIGGERVFG